MTYSTLATSGSAPTWAVRASIAGVVAVDLTSATTWTFSSTNSSPALSPVRTTKKPASRTSMKTIVAVAARLITAFRQKPCQARRRLKTTNEITPRQSSRW